MYYIKIVNWRLCKAGNPHPNTFFGCFVYLDFCNAVYKASLNECITGDFIVYRRISRLAKLPTLHRFILVLTTLCILIIIMSPASGTLTVKAQLSTSTATYHVDDFVSTRGHFDYLATGELISGHNKTDYEY